MIEGRLLAPTEALGETGMGQLRQADPEELGVIRSLCADFQLSHYKRLPPLRHEPKTVGRERGASSVRADGDA